MAFEFEDLPAKACIVQRGMDNDVVFGLCASMNVPAIELIPSLEYVGEFELIASLRCPPPAAVPRELGGRSDVALVLHTSGTTAKPKIVPLHHENLAVGGLQIASCLKLEGKKSVNLNVRCHAARTQCHRSRVH